MRRLRGIVHAACLAAAGALLGMGAVVSTQAPKQILLIADRPSHGPLQHEHNAGAHLFQKWLNASVSGVRATAVFDGWPADTSLIDRADAIFLFCTGGNRHFAFQEDRAASLQRAAERGAGLMFYHYCVEPGAEAGRKEMLEWIGGYFETHRSVNPIWEAEFSLMPVHPITRGVQPFRSRDEWYYNMRFVDGMKGITPLLTAVPGPETLERPDGPHSGNPDVRAKAGQPHTVMWAYERPGGGRGVGFTGGHYHMNLEDPNYRTIVLNALLWIARVEVPEGGVQVATTPEELTERVDPKPQRGGGRGGND